MSNSEQTIVEETAAEVSQKSSEKASPEEVKKGIKKFIEERIKEDIDEEEDKPQKAKKKDEKESVAVFVKKDGEEVSAQADTLHGEKAGKDTFLKTSFSGDIPQSPLVRSSVEKVYDDIQKTYGEEATLRDVATPDLVSTYLSLRLKAEETGSPVTFLNPFKEEILARGAHDVEALHRQAVIAYEQTVQNPTLRTFVQSFEEKYGADGSNVADLSEEDLQEEVARWQALAKQENEKLAEKPAQQHRLWIDIERHAEPLVIALQLKGKDAEIIPQETYIPQPTRVVEQPRQPLDEITNPHLRAFIENHQKLVEEKPIEQWTEKDFAEADGRRSLFLQQEFGRRGSAAEQQAFFEDMQRLYILPLQAEKEIRGIAVPVRKSTTAEPQVTEQEIPVEDAGKHIPEGVQEGYATAAKKVKAGTDAEEVVKNAQEIPLEERYQRAEAVLGEKLSDEQREAIKEAHEVGMGEEGRIKGKEAGVYTYTLAQIREKNKVLKASGLNSEQVRRLMEAGIVGVLPPERANDVDAGAYTDAGVRTEAARLYNAITDGNADAEFLAELAGTIRDLGNAGADPNEVQQLQRQLDVMRRNVREIDRAEQQAAGPQRQQRERQGRRPVTATSPAMQQMAESHWRNMLARGEITQEEADANIRNGRMPDGFVVEEEPQNGVDDVLTKNENNMWKELRAAVQEFPSADALRDALKNGQLGRDLKRIMIDSGYREEAVDKIIENAAGGEEPDLKKTQARVKNFLGRVQKKRRMELQGFASIPSSIEDLCVRIMEEADPETWGWGGKFELIDKEGRVNQDNFLRWLRTQATHWDGWAPDDERNFFSDIKAVTPFRDISFQEMITKDNYFVEESTGKLMSDFRDQCLYEVWLFNDARNWDVQYRRNMGSEDTLSKTLRSLFFTNTFTKTAGGETTLQRILTISKRQPVKDEHGNVIKEGDQLIGQGIRRSLLAYNYIHDLEMLREILGDDAALFQKTYDGKDKNGNPMKKEGQGKGWKDTWYDSSGKLRFDDDDVRKAFIEYIEILRDVKKDPRTTDEVRARMAQSLQTASVKAAADARVEPLDESESKYAEAFAFKMTRWTGIAARSSADAWYKWQKTDEYRHALKQGKRMGFPGNPYSIDSFKTVGLNLLDGITDLEGKTLLEIIQGGTGSKVDGLDKKIAPFTFRANTMQKFTDDYISHVASAYEFIIKGKELKLQDVVVYDWARGTYTVDEQKLQEIKDGIVKNFRYAYGTWDILDLTKPVRILDAKGHAKVVTMAERMFGGGILDKYKLEDNPVDFSEIKDPNERRMWEQYYKDNPDITINAIKLKKDYDPPSQVFWHELFRELFTREVESHTRVDSPLNIWEFGERERALAMARREFFDEEEMQEIRKNSGSGFWKTFLYSLVLEAIGGVIVGSKDALEDIGEGATAGVTK